MPAKENSRRDFFISFTSADRAWAEWIALELEAAGKSVFFQHWDFDPGSNFVLEMHRAAQLADRTLAVLSPNFLGAIYTQPEWAAALLADPTGAKRKLLPMRVELCEPDGLLGAIVYVDLVGCGEEEARGKIRAAAKGGRAKPDSAPFPASGQTSAFPGTAGSGAAMTRTTDPPVRNRAVRLLAAFFETRGERQRQTIFGQAFGDCERSPMALIEWSGSAADFAAHAVDTLLDFGCARRGRHALSLLLTTMAEIGGRQSDPDYHELPRLLDAECGLPTRAEEVAYLDRLIAEIQDQAKRYAPLQAIGKTKAVPKLPHDLKSDPSIAVLLRHRAARKKTFQEDIHLRDYADILTAFGDVRRAVLLGAPGSGKSTTLGKLALDLAQSARNDAAAAIPLLIRLGNWTGDEALAEFVAQQAPEVGWAIEGLSARRRLVLLLDGLNEMPTATRSGKAARSEKAAEVARLLEQMRDAETPVIVSCRAEDYTGALDLDIDTLTLEPLSPRRIQAALQHWGADGLFWQLAGDERLAEVLDRWLAAGGSEESFWSGKAADVGWEFRQRVGWENYKLWQQHLADPHSLLRLAANPFLLYMLYAVWATEEDRRLPKNRGDLFGQFIDQLLDREHLLGTPDGVRLLSGLADLAWQMQTVRVDAGRGENGDFGVLTVAARETAADALGGEALLKKALDCTILEGSGELRFRHQLLQEYFTAQALRSRGTPARELWPPERWWERSGWEVTAVLLAGFDSDDCTPVIRWLAEAQPEVAAQCILESGAGIANEPELMRELRAAWMPRLTDVRREPAPEARAAVGRALGRLDWDNRPGVGVKAGVLDIDWVRIPGGQFLYQKGERRKVKTFYMARYPVTNAQFQAFLDAEDGYRDDLCWQGLTNPERTPVSPSWNEANHPRETVSWYEAMAFCAWLTERLGYEVRLPTEWEWERAARGLDGWAYPWGDEYKAGYANIDETYGNAGPYYLSRTSAVGIYEHGVSAEGVHDLAGNVWEWCLNEYEKPERTQRGGQVPRVLRGGSWYFNQVNALAVDRKTNHPGGRVEFIGFRVGCSSPSAGH